MKNSMRIYSLLILILFQTVAFGQTPEPKQSVTLLFVGDVMGHEPQIRSAFDEKTQTYNYHDVFAGVSSLFNLADITIANLEVTLGGEP